MKKVLFSILLLAFAAGPALADMVFEAELMGSNEVPPVESGAYGLATIILNEAQTQASYTVIFAGLEGGAQTGAHFHMAPADENGPVVFPLDLGSPVAGTWDISPEDAQALIDGNIYVNIHTEGFPAGEIRGQMMFTVVATENSSWSQIKSIFR